MSDEEDAFNMDKTVWSIAALSEAEDDDRAFWLSKTPEERLRALEINRRIVYGYDPTEKIQRVFEITDLGAA